MADNRRKSPTKTQKIDIDLLNVDGKLTEDSGKSYPLLALLIPLLKYTPQETDDEMLEHGIESYITLSFNIDYYIARDRDGDKIVPTNYKVYVYAPQAQNIQGIQNVSSEISQYAKMIYDKATATKILYSNIPFETNPELRYFLTQTLDIMPDLENVQQADSLLHMSKSVVSKDQITGYDVSIKLSYNPNDFVYFYIDASNPYSLGYYLYDLYEEELIDFIYETELEAGNIDADEEFDPN